VIWLLRSAWALDCSIPVHLLEGGTIRHGFESLYNVSEAFVQVRPHWNDEILRMSVFVDREDTDTPLSVRWESDISGVLRADSATQHMQLWAQGLRTGTHRITVEVQDEKGDVCQDSVTVLVSSSPLRCGFWNTETKLEGFGGPQFLNEDVPDVYPVVFNNPYPGERVIFPLVDMRADQNVHAWIEEEGVSKPHQIRIGVRGEGNLVLPPRKEAHQLTLVVESETGRRCTSVLQFE
jgi:hypothetical protein